MELPKSRNWWGILLHLCLATFLIGLGVFAINAGKIEFHLRRGDHDRTYTMAKEPVVFWVSAGSLLVFGMVAGFVAYRHWAEPIASESDEVKRQDLE